MTATLRLSYSSLGTLSSCPRKFEFDKLYPKRVRDSDSYAADVGSALHAGYQHYLTHGDKELAIWEFMQEFPFADEWSQPNDYRSFYASLATLEQMFDEAKMDEWELARIKRPWSPKEIASFAIAAATGNWQEPEGFDPTGVVVPAIEVPFEIKFKGLMIQPCESLPEGATISIIGYIDAVMQHRVTRAYRSLDIKTSRMNLADATAKYKYDNQQTPYGIVIDHIAGGAVDEFEVYYLDCYIDLVEPRVTFYPFLRRHTDIEEWATNKAFQFQAIRQYAELGFFPRTDNGCLFYNRPCRYMEPCQSRDRDTLVEWFTMGEEPAKAEDFHPWIVAEVDMAA